MIKKVQALLTQADHPNTGPVEAATFRAKAEALMFKHRIDEAMAVPTGAPPVLPQWTTITVTAAGEFRNYYAAMFSYCAAHVGVKYRLQWNGQIAMTEAVCVGYEADLKILETLYVGAMMAFGQRIEPKYDPELSEQVNAYLMRSAGMEGRRIAQAIYGRDDKNLRPKVRAMFKKECELRGEDPSALLGKGVNVKGYRTNYAHAFTARIAQRLHDMRIARGEFEQGMVLASREENIKEAFYERFPELRPSTRPAIGNTQAECKKCEKAKSGYCRDHQWMKPRTSSRGGVRYDSAAQARGRAAADSADIGARPGGGRINAARKELG